MLAPLFTFGCAGGSSKAHTIDWIELRTRDIRLQTELPEELARVYATTYQQMRDAIADNELPCAFEQISEPLTVTLIDEHWHAIVGGGGVDGFHGVNRVELIDVEPYLVVNASAEGKSAPIFLHELTHRLVSLCFPNAPLWLDEGLAKFYESSKLEGESLRIGFPTAMFVRGKSGYGRNDAGEWFALYSLDRAPTLEALRAMDYTDFYDDPANYLSAWVAVHLMQLGDSTLEPRFRAYLTALSKGVDEELAWRRAFATIDMEARYRAHLIDRYVWGRHSVSVAPLEVEQVQAMSRAAVGLRLSQFYDWGDRRGAQRARAYMRAAHHEEPSSVVPMLYLAALYDARGDDKESLEWLRSALETDPSDPRVLASALKWHTMRASRDQRGGETTQRLDAWAESLERDGQTAFQLSAAADWFRVSGQSERALQLAGMAIHLDPRFWPAHESAGLAAMQLRRYDLAVEDFHGALRLLGHAAERREARLRSELAEAISHLEADPSQ
jgi:tetratricopeptide (TPR) repeat protein